MSLPPFLCVLAPSMNDFVAFKRSQGYDYNSSGAMLWYFDRHLFRSGYDRQDITSEVLESYAVSMRHLAHNTQYGRLATARVFARWLRCLLPGSAVMEYLPVKRPTLPRHYLYSHAEVAAIIKRARQLGGSCGSIRPLCHATLIGLLYTTGLRIGEALALNVDDLDLARNRLTVRRGKLGKARNAALSCSTTAAIGRYLDARRYLPPNGRESPMFVRNNGKRMSYTNASTVFRSLLQDCKIGVGATQAPRLHDLRHTFACDCLRKWYEEGVDVNARLPVLATAMGHVNIHDTQIYLHVTAQIFYMATDRFHGTFCKNIQGAPQ